MMDLEITLREILSVMPEELLLERANRMIGLIGKRNDMFELEGCEC